MFGIKEMEKIVFGGRVTEEEAGKFSFARMTEKQYGYFTRPEDARFLVRMRGTGGMAMDFFTDARSLSFDYEICGMADRDIVQLDICQNGILCGGIAEKPGIHTTGHICHKIDRDAHSWNRITVWLPYMSNILIKNVELFPAGASLRALSEGSGDGVFPGIVRKKLLCFGDSITQGYDALHPSQTYAVRLARYFDMELWNAGLSGYIFDADFLDAELAFRPDVVTIAFGTNDWNWAETMEQAVDKAEKYFDKIREIYEGCRIIYMAPLWRADTGAPTNAGEFRPFCRALLWAAKKRGFETVDGYLAAPHRTEALADEILHPNDGGMACVCEYLSRHFLREETGGNLFSNWRPEGY